jgi:predicted RecB family nuclease
LAELRSPRDHEKSDHESMTNFENLFQRYEHRKQLLDYDEYDVETESYDDSNSFVD